MISHHGEYEYGSPKLPMTLEAVALHHLDNLDAKMASFTQLMVDCPNVESNWTQYHTNLGRKLYKGAGVQERSKTRRTLAAMPTAPLMRSPLSFSRSTFLNLMPDLRTTVLELVTRRQLPARQAGGDREEAGPRQARPLTSSRKPSSRWSKPARSPGAQATSCFAVGKAAANAPQGRGRNCGRQD